MKPILLFSCLALSASARRLFTRPRFIPDYLTPEGLSNQIAMPPTEKDGADSDLVAGVIISDVIGKDQQIAIFSGLTRDIDSVSSRLDDSAKNATVLAPDNSVMRSLPRKPWEDPADYDKFGTSAYAGTDGEDRAHKNLRRFVEAHIIPDSPWKENQKVETLAGNTVWFENKDGKKFIQPGDIEVDSIAEKVGNGEVWIIKGVINYA